jgi:hypothetical protein
VAVVASHFSRMFEMDISKVWKVADQQTWGHSRRFHYVRRHTIMIFRVYTVASFAF